MKKNNHRYLGLTSTILFISTSSLIAAPFLVSAAFERDLYFGLLNDPNVTGLQEFMHAQGVYDGPVTGNFLSLTREGVKKFQEREGIKPTLGYFGPLTRARVNSLLGSFPQTAASSAGDQVAALQQEILRLQKQIEALLQSQQTQVVYTPPAPESAPTPVAETKPEALEVSGGAEFKFPQTALTPLKLGTIVIYNGTKKETPLSQIVLKITEDLNSSLNRGKKVFLTLTEENEISKVISQNPFTFSSVQPQAGLLNDYNVNMSYPVILLTGDEKRITLWLENLDLVLNGTLKISFSNFLSSETLASVSGGFTFIFLTSQ